jgi:subfamily B ATP-binding cassette protein MsbA
MDTGIRSFAHFWRLVRYALPFRRVIALVLFFMLLYGFANGLRITLIEPVLKNFKASAKASTQPSLWSRLTGRFLPSTTFEDTEAAPRESAPEPDLTRASFRKLVNLGICFGVFSVLIGIAVAAREYFLRYLVNRAITDVRRDLFCNLVDLDLRFYDNQRLGDLISRVTNDIQTAQTILRSTVDDLVQEPLTLVFLVAGAFLVSWQLSLFTFLIVPLILYPLFRFGKMVRRHTGKSLEKLADATEVMGQAFSGIKIVKGFRQEDHEKGRFNEANEGYFRKSMRVVRAKALSRGVIEFFYNAGSGVLVILGALLVVNAVWGLRMETLITYLFFIISMYQPLKTLSKAYNSIQEGLAGAGRVFHFVDLRPGMKDAPDPVEAGPVERGIAFRGVSFAYETAPVLRDISFEAKAGEVVAFVGESGAGKSTLLNLLARFYDVSGGSIEIDGVDLRRIRLASLRDRMALVTQDPFLFNATVAENILYGRPGATRAEMEEAARAALIHDFVTRELELGYDTVVGERGVKLSGGQKQRITIARAIVRNPRILILDEATASLDSESETQVQAALQNLMKGRTTFVIAHRLSTIQNADRIVVLEKGGLVEMGTHAELLARGGVYARLHQKQFGPPRSPGADRTLGPGESAPHGAGSGSSVSRGAGSG